MLSKIFGFIFFFLVKNVFIRKLYKKLIVIIILYYLILSLKILNVIGLKLNFKLRFGKIMLLFIIVFYFIFLFFKFVGYIIEI